MVTASEYRVSEIRRFLMVVGGVGASVCISTFYGFNLISKYMQTIFHFSATDLTTITTTGIVVGFATFPGGMLLDYAGPTFVLVAALVLNALGILLYGLAFQGVIAGSVLKFSVFSAIMNLGCASFDTGSLMAILGSFPVTKGPVVAIMKTYAGMGASILAVIQYSFFRTTYANYMYFLDAVVVFCGTIAVVFIRFPPYHLVAWEKKHVPMVQQMRRKLTEEAYLTQRPPMVRFYLGYGILMALLVYLTVQSFCVAYAHVSNTARTVNTAMIIVLVFSLGLIAAPLPFLGGMDIEPSTEYPELPDEADMNADGTTPAEAQKHRRDGAANQYEDEAERKVLEPTRGEQEQDQQALDELYAAEETYGDKSDDKKGAAEDPHVAAMLEGDENRVLMEASDMDPQYQTTFLKSLCQPDIWLAFWNTLATWGCGIVTTFNSAQIYSALNDNRYDPATNTMIAAMIGVGSAFGRMSMGIFEYELSRRSSDRRPVVTVVYPLASILMVLGLIFLLALPIGSKALVVGFFLDSLGNGFSWACTALTIRSVFAKDIGKHYNFMFVGVFIAVICLNRFAFGEIYDRQAKANWNAIKDTPGAVNIYPNCAGKKCVEYTFIILLAVNATAIAGSVWFHVRYSAFVHKHRAAARAQQEESQAQITDSSEPIHNEPM